MKKIDGIYFDEANALTDKDFKKLERKLTGHPRFMPAFLCTIVGRFNRELCRLHSDCERYRLGYKHRGDNCECLKVHYEGEIGQ